MYSQVYRHSTKWRLCDKMWILAMLEEDRLESLTDYFSFRLILSQNLLNGRSRSKESSRVIGNIELDSIRWTCLRRHDNDLFYFIGYLRISSHWWEQIRSLFRNIDNEAPHQTNIYTAAGWSCLSIESKRCRIRISWKKFLRFTSFLWPMPRRDDGDFVTQEASHSNKIKLVQLIIVIVIDRTDLYLFK